MFHSELLNVVSFMSHLFYFTLVNFLDRVEYVVWLAWSIVYSKFRAWLKKLDLAGYLDLFNWDQWPIQATAVQGTRDRLNRHLTCSTGKNCFFYNIFEIWTKNHLELY